MKRIIAFTLVALLLLTTACQPTPENPIVIQKDLDRLIEAAQSDPEENGVEKQLAETRNALATRLGVPERYSIDEAFHQGKLRIIGNALIEVPSVEKVPVVRVTHENFSQEMANTLVDILCSDTTMYQRMALPSKEDVAQQIILLKQQMVVYDGDESAQRAIQNQIKEFEAFQKIAPDKIVYEVAGPEIKPQPVYNMHTGKQMGENIGVNIAENPSNYGGNVGKYFQIQNNMASDEVIIEENEGGWSVFSPGSRGASFYFSNYATRAEGRRYIDIMDVTTRPLPNAIAQRFGYTPQDAVADALAFWQSIGLDDVQPYRVRLECEFDKATFNEVYTRQNDQSPFGDEDVASQYLDRARDIAYSIEFMRSLDGVPISSDGPSSARLETNEFSRVWNYEKMQMTLTSSDILSMYWVSPHRMTEIVTDDSALLSFEAIDAIFRQMFGVVYADTIQKNTYDEDELREMRFELERVRFSLRRVMEQNQVDFGLLVPVWDFYGTQIAVNTHGHEDRMNLHEPLLLTINAIDGSIIDIDRGY